MLIGLVTVCGLGPFLVSADPLATDSSALELPPLSDGHLLGTDSLGRDVLARFLHGGRTSLAIGLLAGGLSVVLGTMAGAVAGLTRGWIDSALTWLGDTLLAVPQLIVVLAIQALTEPTLTSVVVVIAATSWMQVARVVRSQALHLRERPYVTAATAVGTPPSQILLRHILPFAIAPVLATAAYQVSSAILTETTLSFLGLGVPPHHPTWGNLLQAAQVHLLLGAWWDILWPGGGLVATIVAVNAIASRQRDTAIAVTES